LLFFLVILTIPLVEFATVGKTKDGKIYHHLWNADEITALLKQHGLAKEDEEPETGEIK
jgi:20S proteasome subunit alpha 3